MTSNSFKNQPKEQIAGALLRLNIHANPFQNRDTLWKELQSELIKLGCKHPHSTDKVTKFISDVFPRLKHNHDKLVLIGLIGMNKVTKLLNLMYGFNFHLDEYALYVYRCIEVMELQHLIALDIIRFCDERNIELKLGTTKYDTLLEDITKQKAEPVDWESIPDQQFTTFTKGILNKNMRNDIVCHIAKLIWFEFYNVNFVLFIGYDKGQPVQFGDENGILKFDNMCFFETLAVHRLSKELNTTLACKVKKYLDDRQSLKKDEST
ncbi:hypothetical protein BLNAU_22495 [Blattamonas nauphoetae]|uniref:Uncharacterized protein n=1 Tax=Blattamonas nauphoetae TaxID=2049346 RepID=A0ABQ9WSZ3_9EUKA|nr:hypothetical protein BLNAU_24066 [Blattamonas nauphoetae]KAK2942601.1 hypothetical protein BLNAU_22495 [Blattamonas nauphoetae]